MTSENREKNESVGAVKDQVKAGHTYDGIQEYDNPMPRWWVNLFWATVIFSILYAGYYMTGWGASHLDEYKSEVDRHTEIAALVDKEGAGKSEGAKNEGAESSSPQVDIKTRLVKAALDPEKIKAGKVVYDSRCMPCHGDRGQGSIGPNMTDDHWIHGGSLEQIFHITNVGVPAKGMIPWEGALSEDERINVVAFIRSIQGTKVAGGKAAEGEISAPTELVE